MVRDEALVVLLEQVEVDARLLEEAVEVRARRHLDEVAVALRRLREQREVVDVVLVAHAGGRAGYVVTM